MTPLCNSGLPAGTSCASSPANIVAYAAVNPNAQYIQAGVGALANVGRNTLQLPPINDIDLTAVKRFTITERYRVEFQAQFYNLFNHPQYVGGFLNDIAPVGYTGFQRAILEPSSTIFNQPSQVFSSNARTLQLALKIYF